MKVELEPFKLPEKVIGNIKTKNEQKVFFFELNELSPQDLSELCDKFRIAIFNQACLIDPKPQVNIR